MVDPYKQAKNRKITIKGEYCINNVAAYNSNGKAIIKGYILDRSNGNDLPGTIIVDEKSKLGTTATKDGQFEIQVSPSKYKLKVTHIGNDPLTTKAINLKENTITEIYFYLGTNIIK